MPGNADEIIRAAGAREMSTVTRLLDAEPSLAVAANMFGSQPAHAAYFGGHREVFDRLLSRGVELTSALAAELGMLDIVRIGQRQIEAADFLRNIAPR